jgi:uncharacterized membrane protein YdbT with pleckstrin-like domain
VSFTPGPGEQVLFEGHPSWRAIIDFYLKGAAVTGVLVVLVVLWGRTIGDGVSTSTALLVLALGVSITALAGFLKRVATRYTITNRRLHIKHGIVSREVQETRLARVQDVTYKQSLIQRLLQIGDIDFDTAANDPTDFVFSGVAEPARIVDTVHHATRHYEDAGLGDHRGDDGRARG